MPKLPVAPPLPKKVTPLSKDQLPDLQGILGELTKLRGRNLSHLSLAMGYHKNSMYAKVKRNDMLVSELMALSEAIGHNLLDVYMMRMPEYLQTTNLSRSLGLELDAKDLELAQMRQELEAAKRERDVYLDLLKAGR